MPPGSRKGSAMVTSASMQSSKQHHPPFVPDYTVKAVSDVIYLRIKRPMYCAALKASKMADNPKSEGGTEQEHVLDRYLERVNEDEDNPDILVIGTPRAETRSLRTNPTSKNGSAMRLADREEDGREGEFWGESRSTVRADSIGTEVRDVSRMAANAGGSSSDGPASLPMGGGGGSGDGCGGGSSTALLEKEGSSAPLAEAEHVGDGGGPAEGR